MDPTDRTPAFFNQRSQGRLPGLLGVDILEVSPGRLRARLPIRPELLAPNGYLHAGTVVSFSDTCAGYGCIASLPEGASSFTTIDLTSNFLGTARSGVIVAEALMRHGGRTTQVWDVTVNHEENSKVLALFRCTQLLLK
jgi:1,4-dihydroxy-2-naphthoyl-CoA hydrolase